MRLSPFVCAAVLLASGCAEKNFYVKINDYSVSERYETALSDIETNKKKYYPKNDTLLYFLDTGMLNSLAGKYSAGNGAFEKAKQLAEKLYTKSISAEGMSLLTNDSQKPYEGEDYEIGMLYLIKALNYAALGSEDGALVEIRQLDHFFKTISLSRGSKASEGIIPGALYISGIMRESSGDINGALIDYKNAVAAFEKTGTTPPRGLLNGCYAAAVNMGFRDDADKLKEKYALKENEFAKAGKEEIIIIHINGPAPVKIGRKIEISFGEGWAYAKSIKTSGDDEQKFAAANSAARGFAAKKTFSVSFPEYTQPPYSCAYLSAEIAGLPGEFKSEKISDITSIAGKCLADRINRIRAKSIARTWIKHVLAGEAEKKAEKSGGALTGFLVGGSLRALGAATEQADIRLWRTIGAEITVCRIPAEVGTFNLRLNLKNRFGANIGEKVLSGVTIKKNKKTFLTVRTFI
ncbi:hypothetical protein KKH42_04040 [bacterium]|nr:hypothetical protein [bacterium]